MKKLISAILLLAICVGCFVGCAPKEDANLNAAKEYLYTMYKDNDVKTTVDYTVVSQVRIEDVVYPITWTTDVAEDLVKIAAGENNMTNVDINETPSVEVNYKLIATLKNEDGQEVSVSFPHMIPKALTMKEIVEQAYQLESGKAMEGIYTLEGVISNVDTPWSADYKNITVTIKVEGVEDKPIMCYRLKGEGADALKVGDTITVRGAIKNYNGTVEFDAGCELLNVVPGEPVEDLGYDPTGKAPAEIVDAAYALEEGEAMSAEATLTGVIVSVDTEWSEDYKNITVTIQVAGKEDKPIMCYRMKGEGAEALKVGDTIACTGILKNYKGTIEFDAGCAYAPAAPEFDPAGKTAEEIVDAAYALEAGKAMSAEATLTGVISAVDTAWNADYKNITVTIQVAGKEDKPIMCYRMKGEGAEALKVGDTITCTGILKNYNGTIEFDAGCVVSNIVAVG